MVYTANIPQATDDPSESQPLILNNFQELNTQFGVDHVAFDAVTNNGNHNQATFPNQSPIPSAPGSAKVRAYAKTVSGITMPYYKRDLLPTEFPLSPIKASANFNSLNGLVNGNVSILQSFNISGPITQDHPVGLQRFNITLTNACISTNYIVLVFGRCQGTVGMFFEYTIVSETSFNFSVFSSEGPLTYPTTYNFIVIEP